MELERDGLIIDMYQLLWQKSDVLSSKFNNFRINLPDTVLFNQNMPVQWYFTNKEGVLTRHKKQKITLEQIEAHFIRKCSKSQIVGYYLSEQLSEEYLRNNIFKRIKDKNEVNSHEKYSYNKVCFEYITTENFKQFLYEKVKERGIFQYFVEPYGQFNSMIQVDWGPNICLFSKKANINKFNDKLDVYEKVATFEGPVFLSRVVPFSSVNQTQYLRNQIQEMVDKVQIISSDLFKIRRMIAFFKIDKNSKTQFLFCTSCRIEKNSKVEKAHNLKNYIPLVIQNNLKYPKNVKAIYTINKMSPKKLIQDIKCILCEQAQVYEDLIPVHYQFIIDVQKKLDVNVLKPVEQMAKNGQQRGDDPDENILFFRRIEQKNMDQISSQMDQKAMGKRNNQNQETKSNIIIQKNIEQMVRESDVQYKYKKDAMLNQKIPFLFRKLHPYLSYQEYKRLESDINFRQRKTSLCLECYLYSTQQQLTAGSYPITKPHQKRRIIQQLEENPNYQDAYQTNLIQSQSNRANSQQQLIYQQELSGINHSVRNQQLFQQITKKMNKNNSKDAMEMSTTETKCTKIQSSRGVSAGKVNISKGWHARNKSGIQEQTMKNHVINQTASNQKYKKKKIDNNVYDQLFDSLKQKDDSQQDEFYVNIDAFCKTTSNKNNTLIRHSQSTSAISGQKTRDKIILKIKQNQMEIKNIDKLLQTDQQKQ